MSTAFPPGAQCFFNQTVTTTCPTTPDMVSFLNLTDSFQKNYFPAYCINPPGGDGCPYGYCPNADIGGPLIRISAYITNFLVAILIFHKSESLRESFWSQLLTVYSLMISCGVSIVERQLTRVHAILAVATAGSPLSLYIVVYAIRAMWDDSHRLAAVVGPGRILPRLLVITALGVWIALVVYIVLPSHLSYFAQTSCDNVQGDVVIKYFYVLPIMLFIYMTIEMSLQAWLTTLPIFLTIFAWFVAIWLRREDIWPPGQKFRFNFCKVWQTVRDNYPFIYFSSVVLLPFTYWCATIEISTLESDDDVFKPTFGQILALFVAIPPMIASLKLLPRFGRWFVDLTWVRLITCRRRRRSVLSETDLVLSISRVDSKPVHLSLTDNDRGMYDKVVPLLHDEERL